jgi:hypothetical protein
MAKKRGRPRTPIVPTELLVGWGESGEPVLSGEVHSAALRLYGKDGIQRLLLRLAKARAERRENWDQIKRDYVAALLDVDIAGGDSAEPQAEPRLSGSTHAVVLTKETDHDDVAEGAYPPRH